MGKGIPLYIFLAREQDGIIVTTVLLCAHTMLFSGRTFGILIFYNFSASHLPNVSILAQNSRHSTEWPPYWNSPTIPPSYTYPGSTVLREWQCIPIRGEHRTKWKDGMRTSKWTVTVMATCISWKYSGTFLQWTLVEWRYGGNGEEPPTVYQQKPMCFV